MARDKKEGIIMSIGRSLFVVQSPSIYTPAMATEEDEDVLDGNIDAFLRPNYCGRYINGFVLDAILVCDKPKQLYYLLFLFLSISTHITTPGPESLP